MAETYFSNKKEELERFINLVAEEILQENTSLFLGAGSSRQYSAPNWSELIDLACPKCEIGSNVDKAQYAELIGTDIKTEICKQLSIIKLDSAKKNKYLS